MALTLDYLTHPQFGVTNVVVAAIPLKEN